MCKPRELLEQTKAIWVHKEGVYNNMRDVWGTIPREATREPVEIRLSTLLN
jgi:hypothetical protein